MGVEEEWVERRVGVIINSTEQLWHSSCDQMRPGECFLDSKMESIMESTKLYFLGGSPRSPGFGGRRPQENNMLSNGANVW